MKYYITYSCGHEGCVELFGPTKDREHKLDWYTNSAVCPDCYREQKAIEMEIANDMIEMPYKEYKTKYPNCKTKPGSYNGKTKTIIVYVPKQTSDQQQEEE